MFTIQLLILFLTVDIETITDRTNLINFGILPLIFIKIDDYQYLNAGDIIEIPDIDGTMEQIDKTLDKTKKVKVQQQRIRKEPRRTNRCC